MTFSCSNKISIAAFAAVIAGALTANAALAEDVGAIVRGGKIYDNWYNTTKADKPKDTHALWPASNTKKKGATTWRCKSCHGWDLMGKDGAYASGSYQTGITGVRAKEGADPMAIVEILKAPAHGYGELMSEADLNDVALFVSKGQVDMDTYIDRSSKAPKGGDAAKGAGYFATLCAQCHGKDGKLPKDMGKTLGAQMGNPWEVMHKIFNGQPGEQMPALRALDPQITVDIMAHLATLPKEK